MALIIYPATSWDSFCSVADADTIILNEVPYDQRKDKWTAIADIPDDLTAEQQKEVFLRQATTQILNSVGSENLPSTLESELQRACAILANHSVGVDMSNEDGSGNVKRKKIDGVVETEYFSPKEDDSNSMPDNVVGLLSKYNVKSKGSFGFTRG